MRGIAITRRARRGCDLDEATQSIHPPGSWSNQPGTWLGSGLLGVGACRKLLVFIARIRFQLARAIRLPACTVQAQARSLIRVPHPRRVPPANVRPPSRCPNRARDRLETPDALGLWWCTADDKCLPHSRVLLVRPSWRWWCSVWPV